MQLSKRLLAVADFVTTGNRLADVGTDHAYLPIFLIKQKKIPGAIAMDVNSGPLERAAMHIQENGLGDYIETRLSDGVLALHKGEADTAVIAGMGGVLMEKILTDGEAVLECVSELVLQPQSELRSFRRYLRQAGYIITHENIVEEDGKYYPMMRIIHGEEFYDDECLFEYGPKLLEQKHPVLFAYLLRKKCVLNDIKEQLKQAGTEKSKQRALQIEEEMQLLTAALAYYEM